MRRLLAIALAVIPMAIGAQSVLQGVSLVGSFLVNGDPGTQTDPHVSGNVVAYTNEAVTPSEVRVHILGGAAPNDFGIPNEGNADSFSDISGRRIVFTRLKGAQRSIHLHDLDSAQTAELNPTPNSARDSAAIGSGSVAWVDSGLTQNVLETEIVAYDVASQSATRLTDDHLADREPAVTPSGNAIVWTRCNTGGTGCDILRADRDAVGTWTVSVMTGAAGEESRPATDGVWVAYESVRQNDRDIWYQPIGGGTEMQLPLTEGVQQNASMAGGLIAFESRPNLITANFDIYIFDTSTALVHRVTSSAEDERLTDIDVDPQTGHITVVYARNEGGDENVYAVQLALSQCEEDGDIDNDGQKDALDSCASPGSREAVGTLTLTRTTGAPNIGSTTFTSQEGVGLLCIENSAPTGAAATSARVALNGVSTVRPSDLKRKTSLLEKRVHLEATNTLVGTIAGAPGSSYQVTVYGPPVCGGGVLRSSSSLHAQAVDESTGTSAAGGCSSTSGAASVLALLAAMALLLRPRVSR